MCEIDVKELLDKINIKHEKGISKKPNLFSILDISNREVLICRFIAYLLNPKGNHGMETVPLEEFLKETEKNRTDYSEEELKNAEILKQIEEKRKKYKKEELKNAEIVLEEKIENDRRVDIVIYIGNDIYPIEVKIWAKDQQAQLSDYYNFYKKRYFRDNTDGFNIFYLTPDGHEPSEDSRGTLDSMQIKRLSFDKHISRWIKTLKKWIELKKPDKKDRMDYILEEFKEVIKQMCAEYAEKEKLWNNVKKIVGVYEAEQANEEEKTQAGKELETLLVILSHSEDLWIKIRDEYISKALKFDTGKYQLVARNEMKKVLDKNCIYGIKKKDDYIAYICVATNLYIACEPGRTRKIKGWKSADGYSWRYIGRKNNEKLNLKDPNPDISMTDVIDINKILCEINELK